MPWPELYDAKKKSAETSNIIEKLLKEHNSLSKKEIAQHKDKLLADIDESIAAIDGLHKEMLAEMKNHRKQLEAKSEFLKRHNSRKVK